MALVWAAGIIWLALDVAGTPDEPADNHAAAATDALGNPVDPEQARQIEQAIANL